MSTKCTEMIDDTKEAVGNIVGTLFKLLAIVLALAITLLLILVVTGFASVGIEKLWNKCCLTLSDTVELDGDDIRVGEVISTEKNIDTVVITLSDVETSERYTLKCELDSNKEVEYSELEKLVPGDIIKHNSNLEYRFVLGGN